MCFRPPEVSMDMPTCPFCNETVNPLAKTCPACGKPLKGEATQPSVAPASGAPAAPASPKAPSTPGAPVAASQA